MSEDAELAICDYYEALRSGEDLHPFFAQNEPVVKFGIGERLIGYGEIEAGLREQTRTTEAWEVESRDLRVGGRDCHAWFADDVFVAWTDTRRNVRLEFDTRWSGTLERREEGWRFVGMHVSTSGET